MPSTVRPIFFKASKFLTGLTGPVRMHIKCFELSTVLCAFYIAFHDENEARNTSWKNHTCKVRVDIFSQIQQNETRCTDEICAQCRIALLKCGSVQLKLKEHPGKAGTNCVVESSVIRHAAHYATECDSQRSSGFRRVRVPDHLSCRTQIPVRSAETERYCE